MTAQSLLSQNVKADKVVLYLADSQFPNKEKNLPKELLALKEKGLTISWSHDIKSYKKLIPALKEYPNDVIITADDDIIYPQDWFEKLYRSYLKYPHQVHCHRARKIIVFRGKLIKYVKWQKAFSGESSFWVFPIGVGGILYPPNVFHKEIINENCFMSIAPHGDDIWFWTMYVMNNVKARVVKKNYAEIERSHSNKFVQNEALWHTNMQENDKAFSRLFDRCPEVLEKLKKVNFLNECQNIRRRFIMWGRKLLRFF